MNNPVPMPSEESKSFFTKKVMNAAAGVLLEYESQGPVTVVYHNDTDGLASGAIMQFALERTGRKVLSYCMEQVYPQPLQMIYDAASGPVVFMDLGISRQNEAFIREKTGSRPTVIIDHHGDFKEQPDVPVGIDNVFDVNCNKYGIDGDRYSSASTLTYLVASKMTDVDSISSLAVLGAFSDKNHMQGEEKGFFSAKGLDYAVMDISSDVKIDDGIYRMRLGSGKDFMLMEQIVQDATLLGSIGYRKKGKELGVSETGKLTRGPDLGILLLTQGYSDKIESAVKQLTMLKENAYEIVMNRLREGDYELRNRVFFFDARSAFQGMGVKTIGTFCDYLLSERFKNQLNFMEFNRYVLGGQVIEPVPFGELAIPAFPVGDVLKISVRTPRELKEIIDTGSSIDVMELLKKATPNQVGSSHRLRGATVVPRKNINQFLAKCESLIKSRKTKPLDLSELDAGVKS